MKKHKDIPTDGRASGYSGVGGGQAAELAVLLRQEQPGGADLQTRPTKTEQHSSRDTRCCHA